MYDRGIRFNTPEEVEYLKSKEEELEKLLDKSTDSYLAAKAARDAALGLARLTGNPEDQLVVDQLEKAVRRICREQWKARRDHDLAVIVARPAGYIARLVGVSRGCYWRSAPEFWPVGPRHNARRDREQWA